jgi:outer membrane lipoprotein SlyB
VQGKLDTATGKFTPAEFTKAERARYTKFGGTIPETKAKPQNKLLGTLTGAAAGAAVGAMLGGPLGALIGGVAGGVLGSGILSGGESDPNKPKRSSFPRGRAGTKRYSEAMKKYKAQKQQAAEKKKASDANKPKRSDFPMGRAGGKAYSEALKKHQSGDSTTAQPASSSPEATKRHAELMKTTDPSAQKRIADYDAKHGKGAYSKMLKKKLNKIYSTKKGPDMKISGPALGRLAMGALGGAALGPMGMMGGMMGGALLSGMNIKDGNIGKPTAQEQKDFDTLAASKEKLRQSEARLAKMNPSISMPGPPSGGGNNVKVVRMPSPGGGDNPNDKNTGGSDVDAAQTGNGNKAKWNILGIPMPF